MRPAAGGARPAAWWLPALAAALVPLAGSRPLCFDAYFTMEFCCGPRAHPMCWEAADEDERDKHEFMRKICCLENGVKTDRPASPNLREEVDDMLNCRWSPAWTHLRRLLSTVIQRRKIIATGDAQMSVLSLLMSQMSHLLFSFAPETPVTYLKDNVSFQTLKLGLNGNECFLGTASALLAYVLASDICNRGELGQPEDSNPPPGRAHPKLPRTKPVKARGDAARGWGPC